MTKGLRSWLDENPVAGQLGPNGIWLSIGAYSLILIARHNEAKAEIGDALKRYHINHEVWLCDELEDGHTFSGCTISYVIFEELSHGEQQINSPTLDILRGKASTRADDTFGFMVLELCTLLSVVHSRSRQSYDAFLDDCIAIEGLVSTLLQLDSDAEKSNQEETAEPSITEKLLHNPTRQDILLTLNAGLSRMVSQVFAGTSPIIRTECLFWPHSFLGIGVASLALRNVSQFVSETLNDCQYNQVFYSRMESSFPPNSQGVNTLDASKPVFRQYNNGDWRKMGLNSKRRLVRRAESEEPAPNPITYFSGCDGFRNGTLTTSAPLNSIAGCNSYQWNLGTITHELSDRIIGGKLTKLFIELEESVANSTARGLGVKEHLDQPARSVSEVAHRLLGSALLVMASYEYNRKEEALETYSRPDNFSNRQQKSSKFHLRNFSYMHLISFTSTNQIRKRTLTLFGSHGQFSLPYLRS